MSIKINISDVLRQYTNSQQVVEIDGSTVGQCLDHLVKQFPSLKHELFDKNGELHGYIDIYVNEKSAYPHELAKPVKDGDKLHILFIFGGG